MKSFIILFMLLSSSTYGKVIDRVLLTINQIPYTQRHFEVYIALKESLRDQPPQENFYYVSPQEFSEALNFFTSEHLLLQDLERTSSFKPSQELLSKAKEKFDGQKNSNPGFAAFLKDFDVSEKEQTQLVRQILFVQNYKNSLQVGKESNKVNKEDLLQKKVNELKNNAIVRVLIDARAYQSLNIK